MDVGFNILSVAVKALTEGIDDFFLGGVVLQTLRNRREGFVALNQAVKIRARGGDDDRLAVKLIVNKMLIQFQR